MRVLLVEDSPDDAELVLRALRRGGYVPQFERVETAEAMRAQLEAGEWDVVISDFSLPRFSGPKALSVLRASGLDLPFIVVSGTVGEENAVALLKAGAYDFVIKSQLARLVPAIERELRELEERRGKRRAEGALRASEARFRAIMNVASDAVIAADAEGRVTYANPAAERMFGFPVAELVGQPLTVLMPERFVERHLRGLRRFAATGNSRVVGRKVELVGRRRDGSEFPIDLSLGTWEADGRRSFAGFIQDLTERKEVEAKMFIADRMATVGLLGAGVAHEINNPLAAVMGNLELALSAVARLPGFERVDLEEWLRDAQTAASSIREIVRDLKVFARGEDERPGPVDVRRVLESSLRLARNELRHHATVVKSFADVPPVRATEARLGQVFLNLIVNAAQAIGERRGVDDRIAISTRVEGERVAIEIADTGPGIDPAIRARLFTPFVTTKPVGVGTGLGLSVCHRIVTGFGGEISVDSDPGKGTTFRILLQIARAEDATATGPRSETPALERPAARRGRVLVVDDEPILLKVLERVLERDHEVLAVGYASDALVRVAAGERFDVILCDLMMPEMTGMELHAELSRVAPDQAEAMIFMSGGATTLEAQEFLARVPNVRFEKPIPSAELRALVNSRLR